MKGVSNSTGATFCGKVIGRSGKATGIYKNCYNIRSDADLSECSYDVVKDFSEIEIVPDETESFQSYTITQMQ